MLSDPKNPFLLIFITILTYFLIVMPYLLFEKVQKEPRTHYQYLTAGFLSGQLNLSISPSKELLKLKNPYDPEQNLPYRLHDASLYNGKYYLYFGPLPVLTYFLPIKILTTVYPSESSAVLLFLSLGFIIELILLKKITERYFPFVSKPQFFFIGLILGFVNNAPFLLARPAFYEAAIASAFFFMNLALYCLYNLLHSKSKPVNIFLFSLFLSLTMAGRPHFVLICLILIPLTAIYIYRQTDNQRFLSIFNLLFPFLCVGLLLATYNYLRFSSIFEFGQTYQLAGINFQKNKLFSMRFYQYLPPGLLNYLFKPFSVTSTFPYVGSSSLFFIPPTLFYYLEEKVGILFMAPFIALVIYLPIQLGYFFKHCYEKLAPLLLFLLFILPIPFILLLFLITLPGVTQRYETDFLPYFIFLAIMSLWLLDHRFAEQKKLFLIKLFFATTGLMGIYISLVLGMEEYFSLMFKYNNYVYIFSMTTFLSLAITSLSCYWLIKSFIQKPIRNPLEKN